MSSPPFACVVDASVAAQLYIPEPLTTETTVLFGLLNADSTVTFHVPDLFFVECANIFWKYVRRGGCSVTVATAAMANINALRLQQTPTIDLAADALSIALTHGITAYDACYLALAQRHAIPFITADNKLVNKMAGTAHLVTWLGNWAPPPPAGP